MQVDFWGVRGDLARPGADTVRYGGHTLCVTVRGESNNLCILDAGSGLTALGRSLMKEPFSKGRGEALFLISGGNWDHTQGIGFFAPFYVEGNRFTFYGLGSEEVPFYDRLEALLAPAVSPLQTLSHLTAWLAFRESDQESFPWGDLTIRSHLLPPGGGYAGGYRPLAFRVTQDDRVLVYVGEADYPDGLVPPKFVRFCQGADVLIHDAYYAPGDHQAGWGHTPADQAVELARQAAVSRLVLFHYNPAYDDERIDQMVAACQALATGPSGRLLEVIGAVEGMVLTI